MLNGEAVVAQVRRGTWPQDWQVLRAKASHFLRQATIVAVFFVGAAFGLLYLIGSPDKAVVLGGGTLDPATSPLWRAIDFAVLGIALAGLGVALAITLIQSTRAGEQLLVILPEGFVLSTGKTQAYAFASVQTIEATSYRGVITLAVVGIDGEKSLVRLDYRFGNSRQVAQRILLARLQFAAAAPAPRATRPV